MTQKKQHLVSSCNWTQQKKPGGQVTYGLLFLMKNQLFLLAYILSYFLFSAKLFDFYSRLLMKEAHQLFFTFIIEAMSSLFNLVCLLLPRPTYHDFEEEGKKFSNPLLSVHQSPIGKPLCCASKFAKDEEEERRLAGIPIIKSDFASDHHSVGKCSLLMSRWLRQLKVPTKWLHWLLCRAGPSVGIFKHCDVTQQH